LKEVLLMDGKGAYVKVGTKTGEETKEQMGEE
jgi:hypothetical protein